MTLGVAKSELRSIINELVAIEDGIRSEFKGIGEEYCADCVARIVRKYEVVLSLLNRVDSRRLADWALKND